MSDLTSGLILAPAASGRVMADGRSSIAARGLSDLQKAQNTTEAFALALVLWKAEDYEAAVAALWNVVASDLEFLEAWLYLGRAYDLGLGVEEDIAEAARCFHWAAARGLAEAQVELADVFSSSKYVNGVWAEEDWQAAAPWVVRAAEQGHAGAQLRLGHMYQEGLGLPIDLSKAFHWTYQSAQKGGAAAQARLGRSYLRGIGVGRDVAKAEYWGRRSVLSELDSEIFIVNAQEWLLSELYYERGLAHLDSGKTGSRIMGYMWVYIAAVIGKLGSSGHGYHGYEFLRSVEKELSLAEKSQGRRLAREWLEQDSLWARIEFDYDRPEKPISLWS